jgi:hypothetical protein
MEREISVSILRNHSDSQYVEINVTIAIKNEIAGFYSCTIFYYGLGGGYQ